MARGSSPTLLDEAMRTHRVLERAARPRSTTAACPSTTSRAIRADYESFTAEEVRETFARYFRPEARFRVVIVPAQAR